MTFSNKNSNHDNDIAEITSGNYYSTNSFVLNYPIDMKNICSRIDHLVVLCQNPEKTISEFNKIMGLPEYIPVVNHGYFESGLVHLGNIDIEFLQLGKFKNPPFLYGLSLATELSILDLCKELFQRNISFSLPVNTTITQPEDISWAVVFLKGFLDDPFPAGWLPPKIASSPFLINKLAAFCGWLTSPQWIKKLFFRNTGRSMIFFCKFSKDQTSKREQASNLLNKSGGGNFKITSVKSILIEYSNQAHLEQWHKLLPTKGFFAGPQIKLQKGKYNRLVSIDIHSNLNPIPSSINLGEFIINFVS